jgi:hypothetical protein
MPLTEVAATVPRPPPASASSRRLPSLLATLMATVALVGGMVLFSGVPKLENLRRPPSRATPGRAFRPPTIPSPAFVESPIAPTVARQLQAGSDASGDVDALGGLTGSDRLPGDGALELEFVSASDGAPLPELPVVVFRESVDALLIARALTGPDGTLRLEGLPSGELLVATGRIAEHAPLTLGFRLADGEARRATVTIGAGGRATGRVVDDQGQPLSGVAIRLDSRPGPAALHEVDPLFPCSPDVVERFAAAAAEIVATSGDDGRYEVPALLSRAAGFRGAADGGESAPLRLAADGDLTPTLHEPIELFAELDGRHDDATLRVGAHDTVRVPDLVLPRPIAFAGFVHDTEGRPVADALVTSAWDRGFVVQLARPLGARAADGNADMAAWSNLSGAPGADTTDLAALPGEPELVPRRGEALTLANGRFELTRVAPDCQQLWVIVADGSCHSFLVEELLPGERRSDLRLVLPRTTGLFIELATADGAPFDVATGGATASLLRHDGTPFHAAVVATTTPGELALTSELPPEELRAVVLEPCQCERVVVRLREAPAPRARLCATVIPHAELRLELTLPDGSPPPTADRPITLHACLASVGQRLASGEECCGLGQRVTVALEPGTTTVALRLREAAPWHVTVEGPFRDAAVLEFGPFTPSEEPVVLELPPLAAAASEPALATGATAPRARVRFRVVDAVTRTAIDGAVIESCILAEGEETGFWQGSGDDGLLTDELPLAAQSLVVRAFGYAPSSPHPLPRLVVGSTVDVGTVELAPRATWPIALALPAGAADEEFPPLAGCAAWPEATDAPWRWLDVESQSDGRGGAELLGDLPERFILLVGTESPHHSNRLPAWWELRVERGAPGAPIEVPLPELHDVEVVVSLLGIAAPLRAGNLTVTATPDAEVGGLLHARQGAERDAGGAPERRFRFRLPAGSYEFAVSSPIYQAAPAREVVAPRRDVAMVELLAESRIRSD